MMYWTSVLFVGHISLPILAGLAFVISPMLPKRPRIQGKTPDDLAASSENIPTENLGGDQVVSPNSVELDKKKA